MANQADVIIKNNFANVGGIKVLKLKETATIADGSNERIPLPGPEVALVIQAPEGKDTKFCMLKVQSDVDLSVTASRTNSTWTLQIIPNELPPDVPTTVNVSVGDDEP
jgi:hypothetical protein